MRSQGSEEKSERKMRRWKLGDISEEISENMGKESSRYEWGKQKHLVEWKLGN